MILAFKKYLKFLAQILDVRHAGAVLKGAFSRYEFQRENSGVSSVKNFKVGTQTVFPI